MFKFFLALLAFARPAQASLADIEHVIVIYQENWSFDGLYGEFPGADGIKQAKKSQTLQTDLKGKAYAILPQNEGVLGTAKIPNGPFDLAAYVSPSGKTDDLVHRYYHEQLQIHGGKMDRFVAWSDAQGLAMSHFDATPLPEGRLAAAYTLCDRFFHAAFGGSFLNHQWLISASTPLSMISAPPASMLSVESPDPQALVDGNLSPDGKYAINTSYSVQGPSPDAEAYMQPLTNTTIGELLDAHGASWKWYAGGWDTALADTVTADAQLFQFHHQPFAYYAHYAKGSPGRAAHLRDIGEFFSDLSRTALPQVSFLKPLGPDNEHPNYADLQKGQDYVSGLVDAVKQSCYWPRCLIIITYDENGGRWDHVAPPGVGDGHSPPGTADIWGPGCRVPTILVSPWAKRGYVDHTPYDTTSILKLIEDRFCSGGRLGTRDAAVNSLGLAL